MPSAGDKVVSRQTQIPPLDELTSSWGGLPACDHIIYSFWGQIFYRPPLCHGREDEGVKMRYSLYLQEIYHLLQGDIKTITVCQVLWISGVLWGLRFWVGLGKWACGRDKGDRESGEELEEQRERAISFYTRSFHHLLLIQAYRSASLKPLVHWAITWLPLIPELLKRWYTIAISNSSLFILSWIHPCQAFILSMAPKQLLVRSQVTAVLLNLICSHSSAYLTYHYHLT